jgi:hypothetical protein
MFFVAVSFVLLPGGVRFRGIGTIRGPWVRALSGLYIFVGVGLLRRYRWARLATIADAILDIGFLGVALVNGLLQLSLILVLAYLLRLPKNALIVWYLLKPEVGRVFTQPKV